MTAPAEGRGYGAAPGASSSPSDRATTFQAVQGEPEHYSGEKLLVGAYALVWVVVLCWVALMWRRQRSMTERLEDLEREIAKAAAARAPAGGARAP